MKTSILALTLAGGALTLSLAGTAAAASGPPASIHGSLLAIPLVTGEASAEWGSTPRLEAIRHYPRYRRRPPPPRRDYGENSSYRPRGFMQIHGGAFDPEGAPESQWVLGFRAGQTADALQVGVGTDLAHRSFTEAVIVAETVDPTGHVITTTQESFRTSSNLLPVMAFVQVKAPDELPIQPYFGIGGGYEFLFLSSEDFQTGEQHDGTFHGWGWQAWGGASATLGPATRLVGEIFANTGTLERHVDRFESGQPVREEVDVDGIGIRVGLQFGY